MVLLSYVVGMFAVRKDLRSQGIGRLVFDAAEARARSLNCDVCELQLLYPQDRPHAVKDRLRVWYTSRHWIYKPQRAKPRQAESEDSRALRTASDLATDATSRRLARQLGALAQERRSVARRPTLCPHARLTCANC